MNELKHITEFRSVLASYKLSAAAQAVLQQTKLVLLDGPTSAGRNTLINELVGLGDYYHIVSDTTREIRQKDGQPIEKNGQEYWFRSEQAVLDGLNKGQYIEAAIIHNQQVSGCNILELSKAQAAHKIAIKDIDPTGAQTIHSLKPDVIIIFILPPSFEVWMQRLQARGGLPDDEIQRRLASAHHELSAALSRDYYLFLINEDLKEAVVELHAIVKMGQVDLVKQKAGRQLAEALSLAIDNHLQQNK